MAIFSKMKVLLSTKSLFMVEYLIPVICAQSFKGEMGLPRHNLFKWEVDLT